MKVLVFGATGTSGSEVLNQCIKHASIKEIVVIGRRSSGVVHDKVQDVVHSNFTDYAELEPHLSNVDIAFFCLGVSQVKVPDKDKYYEITHEYPVAAAKALLAVSPEHTFCFLSGEGADPSGKSRTMFARVKGEAENTLSALGLKQLYIFRPGYIHPVTPRKGRIFVERVAGFLYPVLKRLTPGMLITNRELADGMIKVALDGHSEVVLQNTDIKDVIR